MRKIFIALLLGFSSLQATDYPDLVEWTEINTLPKELYLYMKPTCPYCVKVMNFIQRNHLPVVYRDISVDAVAKKELIEHGGKRQVPCLFIDGRPLYESNDIISWLADYQKSN